MSSLKMSCRGPLIMGWLQPGVCLWSFLARRQECLIGTRRADGHTDSYLGAHWSLHDWWKQRTVLYRPVGSEKCVNLLFIPLFDMICFWSRDLVERLWVRVYSMIESIQATFGWFVSFKHPGCTNNIIVVLTALALAPHRFLFTPKLNHPINPLEHTDTHCTKLAIWRKRLVHLFWWVGFIGNSV